MNKSIPAPARGLVQDVSWTDRLKKVVLSAIAVLFTIAPVCSIGLWINNVYFSDPRDTIAMTPLATPGEPPKLFQQPLVSVTFDDGWESSYTEGAPVLQKYDILTTHYILSGQFDRYNYLSEEQVLSLQHAGHEIQSHTVTHADLTQLTNEELQLELQQSKQDISELTGRKVTHFASPLSSYDQRTIKYIKQSYRSHRNTNASPKEVTDQDYNTKQNFNRWQINAFSVTRSTTAGDIERFLRGAKAREAWAVLVYHEIDKQSDSYYAVTPDNFDKQMKAVKQSQLRIATMGAVMNYYDNRLASGAENRP